MGIYRGRLLYARTQTLVVLKRLLAFSNFADEAWTVGPPGNSHPVLEASTNNGGIRQADEVLLLAQLAEDSPIQNRKIECL